MGPLIAAAFYVSLLRKGRVARDMRQAKVSMTSLGLRDILGADCAMVAHADRQHDWTGARGERGLTQTGRERQRDGSCDLSNASAGNRTRVTSMATMYSTTRPLMLVHTAGAYGYGTHLRT